MCKCNCKECGLDSKEYQDFKETAYRRILCWRGKDIYEVALAKGDPGDGSGYFDVETLEDFEKNLSDAEKKASRMRSMVDAFLETNFDKTYADYSKKEDNEKFFNWLVAEKMFISFRKYSMDEVVEYGLRALDFLDALYSEKI